MELVDIKFSNLSYHIEEGIFNKTKKFILKDVSGEFRGGELTGILGLSGSGKTSLINCISSYKTQNVTGSIESSVKNYKMKYIMQEDSNFKNLTVKEAMTFSFKFKFSDARKCNEKIIATLKRLGILHTLNHLISSLSSGEARRLSLALEIIDDPKIIVLDEITTGLDSSSSVQCIKLLKMLAMEGRTIICSIHQPSAVILKMFDHIYAMSEGCCIYQGSYENLLPFLEDLHLTCPKNYNPFEYLLEISTTSLNLLVNCMANGRKDNFRRNNNNDEKMIDCHVAAINDDPKTSQTPSFSYRLRQLTMRTMLLMMRDKSNILLRVAIHLVVGLLIGILYDRIGNDAAQIFNEFKYIFILNGFCAYAGFYSLMVKFPLELPQIKREHFNQNFSTLTYQLALLIADFPVTIFCTCLYVSITYFLTDQPLQAFRFFTVLSILLCVSFIAQAYGTFLGCMFELKSCVIMSALLMAAHIIFSGFIVLKKDVHWMYHFIFESIYLKHAFYATASVIFGYNRQDLECNAIYCHFQKSQKFLDMIGIKDDLTTPIIAFVTSFCILQVLTYYRLRNRLKN